MNINPNEHTILVSGATGQQGGAVARHLLKRGFNVRALTRHPDREPAQELKQQGAEIVKGDFENRNSLDRALSGAYGAFSVQDFMAAGVQAETQWGKAFADAAKDAGVKHFVYSSVDGAERESGIPHFESKWKIEQYVRHIGLPNTILRPTAFMDNWTTFFRNTIDTENGTLVQPLSADTPLQEIAVTDIGAFAAIAFSNPDQWLGSAIPLAGDEKTMEERTEIFSDIFETDLNYIQVPWERFQEQAGEDLTLMMRWFENEGYEANIDSLRKIYPNLKRFQPFLQEQTWS